MKKVFALIVTLLIIISTIPVDLVYATYNMTYLYFGSSSTYLSYVNQTNNALQTVSPNYIDVNVNGQLVTKDIDEDFIKSIHDKGMTIVPFLSNHWNKTAGKKMLENRVASATQLANLVHAYNFDGIHIDIEGLNEESRDAFSDFVRLVRQRVPAGKEVSVAVAANPYGSNKGWQGMYDYRELAKYSDYLMIMAYDESWLGSKPGPVSSKNFMENAIKYPLGLGISPSKIVLGIPFYGRIWKVSNNWESMTSSIQGRGISLDNIGTLLDYYDADVTYDREKNSMRGRFCVSKTHKKLNLYSWGVPLEEGNYEIWFENDETIKERIKIANKYGLKGTGSWSLGQEDTTIWQNYDDWLKGHYFKDINGHWAENDILHIYQKDWMLGINSTQFGPDVSLTRAEAAFSLVRALGLDMVNSSYFKDVSSNHWAKRAIETAYANGLIHGKGNYQYAPDEKITREQMSQLLYNYLKSQFSQPTKVNGFCDMKQSDWAYTAVHTMNYHGILKGFGDNTFRPRENITRGQMASLFVRISSYIQ
ncbi:S-layer homology domain-containing protein [Vallitalea pronyensis]|uniref:S-layer homology domain-containing protein n=1 Tax=Vallitalea pronyensis TaxID=1348613 RepID=A0A8J8SHG1_9FIRM|nr:S-layer homology domain-containing protein [Vallitalea pronyensis]QUI23399.1 S-layer homology domain-containing protein [Vallitalea pronyensis]